MKRILLASLLAFASAGAVLAQTAPTASPAGVEVFQPGFFAQFRPNTAWDMLANLPGFSINTGGASRGLGEGGNVLIDGARPSSKTDSLSAVLGRVPASSVERIELVRTATAGIDMQGHDVVANVIRKKEVSVKGAATGTLQVDRKGEVSEMARLEGQRQGSGRLLEGAFTYQHPVAAAADQHRLRVTPAGSALLESDQTGDQRGNYYELSGAYQAPQFGGRLRANLLARDGVSSNVSDEVFTLPAASLSHGGGSQTQTSGEAGLQFVRPTARRIEVEGALLERYNEVASRTALGTASFVSTNTTEERIGRGIIRFPARGAWTFDGGAEAAFNTLDTASTLADAGIVTVLPNSVLHAEEFRTESFANARWAAQPRLRFEFGVRYETSQISSSAVPEKSLQYLKPRVLVSWTPDANQQASLRIEREVNQLSFSAFSATVNLQNGTTVVGNPDIVPDQILVYDARYQWRSGKASLLAEYIYRDRNDTLDRDLFTVTYPDPAHPGQTLTQTFEATANIGDSHSHVLNLNATAPLDRVGLKNGLLTVRTSWTNSTVIDPVTGEAHEISGVTPFVSGVGVTQDLPAIKLRWGVQMDNQTKSFSYRPREINIYRIENDIDVFVERRIGEQTTLRVEGHNVIRGAERPERIVFTPDRGAPGAVVSFDETREVRRGSKVVASLRRNF